MADTLRNLCASSGLKINLTKSKAIHSCGVRPEIRSQIAAIAPIPFVRDLGKYLGFPLKGKTLKCNDFNFILDNIKRKLSAWKTSMLSTSGRICLVCSVMASVPAYLMRRFIWSGTSGSRGWHRVGWNCVIDEREYGGLGVREMRMANTALLGKLVWHMIDKPDKL